MSFPDRRRDESMKKIIFMIVIGITIGLIGINIMGTKGDSSLTSSGVIYENNTTVESALDTLY